MDYCTCWMISFSTIQMSLSIHDQYGISRDARASPPQTQEWFDHLDAIFSQQVQPRSPAPLIETLMWELGRDLLELSNPEWFRNFIACVVESHHTNVDSLADGVRDPPRLHFRDVESYAVMRAKNSGGDYVQLLMELASNTYIPSILRATPYFEQVTTTTTRHLAFANDIFSYHLESSVEQNPRNLITVLMECEGKSLVQAVQVAIGLVSTCARALMDLEAEAWKNPTLRNHLQDHTKALVAGGLCYGYMDKRYRHPDSVFPELRETT